jgi:hypothetical protein
MRSARLTWVIGALAGLSLLLVQRPAEAQKNNNDWGTVKGRIVWGGDTIPKREFVTIDQDPKHCKSEGPIARENLVINTKNKGMRWVFVWLAPQQAGQKLPIHPNLEKITVKEVVMDQPCCKFVPHALGMREGQILLARNSSPVKHNFHWIPHPAKNQAGNETIAEGKSLEIKGLMADTRPMQIQCDLHKWMRAWVRLFDHPYFAVTDEDGNFEIKLAPAGNWRLFVWQEEFGWRGGEAGAKGQPITIKGGGVTDLGNLEMKK